MFARLFVFLASRNVPALYINRKTLALKRTYKVLVVDDDRDILELLRYNLKKEAYDVRCAENGEEAIETAKKFLPDLIILDVMMPRTDGVETCRRLREIPKLRQAYIIFLTARSEEYSEVAAFGVGADDYIHKPIKPRALMSRIAAVFRRDQKTDTKKEVVEVGEIRIDKSSHLVVKGQEKIFLPKKEFEILYFLSKNPDRVYSRDELLENIWGADIYVLPRTVDVHIRKVREKIGEGYIQTVKGVGYKFILQG